MFCTGLHLGNGAENRESNNFPKTNKPKTVRVLGGPKPPKTSGWIKNSNQLGKLKFVVKTVKIRTRSRYGVHTIFREGCCAAKGRKGKQAHFITQKKRGKVG